MDSRKVTRAQDKVKGTGKWQINYLTIFHPILQLLLEIERYFL
jgi:hypothetical protein